MSNFSKNFWYPILEQRTISGKRAHAITRFSQNLVLWRTASGKLTCMLDKCPHKGVALSKGHISDKGIVCGYHGFCYDSDGHLVAAPPCGGCNPPSFGLAVKTYPVCERYGIIWLWWGDGTANKEEIEWFPGLELEEVRQSRILSVHYPISFNRLMESNCDSYHMAYLHSKSVPGFPRVVQEAICSVDGPLISMRTVLDNGRGQNRTVVHNKLMFPACAFASNEDGSFRNVIFCCPIDADTSWFMIGFLTPCFKIPLIGKLLNHIFLAYIKYIVLPEDFRVQQTQSPNDSGYGSDQLVVSADRMVLEYWRLRRHALWSEEEGSKENRDQVAPSKLQSKPIELSHMNSSMLA